MDRRIRAEDNRQPGSEQWQSVRSTVRKTRSCAIPAIKSLLSITKRASSIIVASCIGIQHSTETALFSRHPYQRRVQSLFFDSPSNLMLIQSLSILSLSSAIFYSQPRVFSAPLSSPSISFSISSSRPSVLANVRDVFAPVAVCSCVS